MLLSCPECQLDCSVSDESHEPINCASCGMLLSSGSNEFDSEGAKGSTEEGIVCDQTQRWHAAVAEVLPTSETLPRLLGRYELTALLGSGGFAQVFLANDRQLQRQVALKLPRPDLLETPERMRRFLEEAQSTAKLDHPNIVRIYDVGWMAQDVCFISMEYFPGRSLDKLMRKETFSPQTAAELVAALADAAHHAHLKGFVHRDIKPSNVMLGHDGRPRLVDFGLAVGEARLRELGNEVAGTISFMSPEQLQGDAMRLDGRCDVWSLGVLLYQLLTGNRPFGGNSKQLHEEILHREPRPLRQHADSVPIALEDICLRCLAKAPSDRFTTARELAIALRTAVAPVAPQPQAIAAAAPVVPSVMNWIVSAVAIVLAAAALWLLASRRDQAQQALAVGGTGPAAGVAAPWLLTQDLRFKYPYSLLERNLKAQFWYEDPEADWELKNHEVRMHSNSFALLSIRQIAAPDCDFEVVFSSVGMGSDAGIFFGCQFFKKDGIARWTLQTLSVNGGGFGRDNPNAHYLERRNVEYLLSEDRNEGIIPYEHQTRSLGAQVVPYAVSEPHRLVVQFREGRLRAILWEGEPLKGTLLPVDVSGNRHRHEAADNRQPIGLSLPNDGGFDRRVEGGIGFYNQMGASRFRDARWTLMKGNKNG